MKILAFAASNSKKSINKQLLAYAAGVLGQELSEAKVEFLDINDYAMPIYSEDLEAEEGIPQAAHDFLAKIASADALLIAYAEHNGGYAVAYKNLFDWASRVKRGVYQNRPAVMLATSPGAGGAKNVLSTAVNAAPHFGGEVLASVSVPSFYDNFDTERGVLNNQVLREQLADALAVFAEPVVS